jgi:hypothetical protein
MSSMNNKALDQELDSKNNLLEKYNLLFLFFDKGIPIS